MFYAFVMKLRLAAADLMCPRLLVQKRAWKKLCPERIFGYKRPGFTKAWFWRMCPRSGSWYQGTWRMYPRSGFGTGEHPNVPSFRFWYRGTSTETTLWTITQLRNRTLRNRIRPASKRRSGVESVHSERNFETWSCLSESLRREVPDHRIRFNMHPQPKGPFRT